MANKLTLDVTTGETTSAPETSEEISNRESKLAEWQPVNIREERDAKLAATDWTQVADAPVDQAAWATYRQALRDIPAQEGFPSEVVWPDSP
jgi:hypothetical protein